MEIRRLSMFCLTSLLLAMCAIAASATPLGTWTVNLTARHLPNFLSYPSSGFAPALEVSVDYTDGITDSTTSIRYEDLFYAGSMPIGCNRKHILGINNGTRGKIYVGGTSTSSTLDSATALAAANTIKRLFLALSLKGCPITQIVVPESSYANLIQGLYDQGFFSLPNGYSERASKALIYLEVVSEPPGKSQYVLLGNDDTQK